MKASLESLKPPIGRSFLARIFGIEGYKAPFHYHPEYELTLITEGYGKRFIGNNLSPFESGDLVLVGANIPHCWKLDRTCKKATSIVIQFSSDFAGVPIFDLPEMASIKNMLIDNSGAIVLKGLLKHHLSSAMGNLIREDNSTMALTKLIYLLDTIERSSEKEFLPADAISSIKHQVDSEKILPVFEYIQSNFNKKIVLQEAADMINMSANGFCKYFKRVTRKTFLEAVNDYRIGLAVELLSKTEKPIHEISYDCGFNEVSNFYKAFRKKMSYSPLKYRALYKEKLN
jgi:AraC-like DNA-binding protein